MCSFGTSKGHTDEDLSAECQNHFSTSKILNRLIICPGYFQANDQSRIELSGEDPSAKGQPFIPDPFNACTIGAN